MIAVAAALEASTLGSLRAMQHKDVDGSPIRKFSRSHDAEDQAG